MNSSQLIDTADFGGGIPPKQIHSRIWNEVVRKRTVAIRYTVISGSYIEKFGFECTSMRKCYDFRIIS